MKVFYTILFLFHLSNLANSDTNILNKDCKDNLEKINFNNERPVSINVETLNPRNWTKNLLKMLTETQFQSKSKYKSLSKFRKYQDAKIEVSYKNNVRCNYEGRVKIHGGTRNHRENKTQTTSLRVQLNNGHILNHTHFALILPKARNGNNEIFGAEFFRALKIISPLTFNTTTKVNNILSYDVIFQARDDNEILFYNKKREGIVFSGNKTRGNGYSLARISNINSALQYQKKILFDTLDKLNRIYLFNFSEEKLAQFKDINYKNLSTYEAFVVAMGGGLEREDRKFYYNFSRDLFEPIFNDTDLKIINNDFVLQDSIQNKKGISFAISKLDELDIDTLHKEIKKNNYHISKNKLLHVVQKIKKNLQHLSKSRISHQAKNTNENVDVEKYKEIVKKNNFNLAFFHNDDSLEVCTNETKNCSVKKFSNKQLSKILSNHFLLNKDGSKIKFITNSKNILNNSINIDLGYQTVNYEKKYQISDIKIKTTRGIQIKHNNIDKTIYIAQSTIDDKILFYDSKIADWKIKFIGPNKKNILKKISKLIVKKNKIINNDIGCLTFLNIIFTNTKINISNISCKNSAHILNSEGSIQSFYSHQTSNDSLDIDFSNIEIDNLNIRNSGSECISLKTGLYKFNNVKVANCMHGISIGEIGYLNIKNLNSSFTDRAITSKDNSILVLEKADIRNTKACLVAIKKNKNFDGSVIKYNKNNFICKENIKEIQQLDKYSRIISY